MMSPFPGDDSGVNLRRESCQPFGRIVVPSNPVNLSQKHEAATRLSKDVLVSRRFCRKETVGPAILANGNMGQHDVSPWG